MEPSLLLQEISTAITAERRETLKKELALLINELLLHDFSALVQLLYRVDVPEQKLKAILKENPQEDAGNLMADLIIQRQQEKFRTRTSFPPPPTIPDDEKW